MTVLAGIVLMGCCCNIACNSIPAAMPAEFATAAKQAALSITDQAVWDNMSARMGGHVVDPGMEAYAHVEYAAGVRLKGVSGQVGMEGTGHGTGQLTQEARDAIIDLAREDMSLRSRAIDFLTELGRDLLAKKDPDTQPSS